MVHILLHIHRSASNETTVVSAIPNTVNDEMLLLLQDKEYNQFQL